MQTQRKMEELIFYVLPNQKVNLAQISSQSKIFQEDVQQDLSSQGTFNALKYRHSLGYLGKEYQQTKVPCIPAKQPILIKSHLNESQRQSLPQFIKVQGQSSLTGYGSGKRSAILDYQNKLYRYKGCGNLHEGFFLSNNEPKGCHYFHTLKRELLMTRKINQILMKQLNVTSANIPKFAFQYCQKQIIDLNLKCQAQMIPKYCCVFETIGDRRIGTHVISPLQIIFMNLCDIETFDWRKLFEQNKRIDHDEPVQFLANWIFLQPGQQFIQELSKLPPNQNYIELNKISLDNSTFDKRNLFFEKVLQKLVKNENEKIDVQKIIEQANFNLKNIVQIIVQKIGFEMGQTKRIFCDYGINWGYFNDHGALWHCNAHLNNFISTVPQADSQFVLPLDFDMAFFREQYIRIDLDEQGQKTYGKYDKNQFQNFLCSQYQAMELSVSGIQVMSNFIYSIDYNPQTKQSPWSKNKLARIVFRDTLLKSFRSGMQKDLKQKQRINLAWNQNISQIRDIIKLCLTISQDFQT